MQRTGSACLTTEGYFPVSPLRTRAQKTPGGVRFTKEAANAPIPLPEIKKFDARVQFVESTLSFTQGMNLDYSASVSVEELESAKLSQENGVQEGQSQSLPEEDTVAYSVNFAFVLLDKEGDRLTQRIGERHLLYSGKRNTFEGTVPQAVPVSIVKKVKNIKPCMVVVKCETCQ